MLLLQTAGRRHTLTTGRCRSRGPLDAAALTDHLPVGPPTTGHRRTSRLPDLCTVNSVFRIRIRNFVIPGNITGVTNSTNLNFVFLKQLTIYPQLSHYSATDTDLPVMIHYLSNIHSSFNCFTHEFSVFPLYCTGFNSTAFNPSLNSYFGYVYIF